VDAVLPSRGQQDERQQAARLAALLFSGGGLFSLPLIPFLPVTVSRSLAYGLIAACVLVALLVRRLPWHRWPYGALHVLPIAALAMLIVGGGFIGGSLDYYSLFLPLVFLFAGWVFLPRTSGWLSALALLAFGASLLGAQEPAVAPFFLLSLTLATVCGLVLAHGRLTERRTMGAMRHLLDAATSLGAARDDDEVGAIVAPILQRLVTADDALVVLARDGVYRLAGGSGASPTTAVRWYDDLVTAAVAAGRPVRGSVDNAEHDQWSALAVPVMGASRDLGALVVAFRPGRAGADGFAERMVVLLAAETGRVLERLSATARLAEQARSDALTGLGNRLVLRSALDRLGPGDAVVLCDMDHFKAVNDTYGHATGDRVLVGFADCLREAVRNADTAVRYGGEEFALVLPRGGVPGALGVLNRLRELWRLSSPVTTFSAGIAVHRADATPDATLELADLALYQAKVDGRDRDVVVRDVADEAASA
jgi:diguanylate cyclase (GGDEF)-like protein